MEHLIHTFELLSASVAGSLINAIGEGIILAAAVSLCLRLLPGIKPAARFVIWIAVLFALLPLHLLPLPTSGSPSSLPAHISPFHLDARWSILILCAWAALSLFRAARLLRSALHLRRIAAAATPVVPPPASSALLQSAPRPAQLCTSEDVDRPSVIGFHHPRILLPSTLLQRLSPQELEQILLHELEHLRRRDDWTNLIQKISLILFPLNPVLNWIERRLCIERELACDDRVLHCTAARKAYAACLTNLAEHSMLRRSLSLALGAWEKQSELARRVHRILRRPEQLMGRTAANIATATVIAGLLGGAITLAHSPQLVSFSPSASPSAPSAIQVGASTAMLSQPVRHTQGLSPTLVKAVMPNPSQNTVTQAPPKRHQPAAIKAVRRQSRPRQQNWVVLTSWRVVQASSRPTFTVNESTGSSYAAVPVGNGWLVIQL